MVLIIVGVLFIVGMGAITAATRDTQSGRNFAAYAVALQAAQTGVEVARRRLGHPWDANLSHGEDWPGTGGYIAMPTPTDGRGSLTGAYYRVDVQSTATQHLVTATGRAVRPGGSVGNQDDIMATRTVQALFERPKIEIPYAILAAGDLTLPYFVQVTGDVHSNGNVIINAGSSVNGNVSATGTITCLGTVTGTRTQGAKEVFIPKMVYYGYRPHYDYAGLDNDAVELGGTFLAGNPPYGLPNNPDNVFYTNVGNFTLMDGVNITNGTLVTMYDLTIVGTVKVTARDKFPALLINSDLIFPNNGKLETEGMVKVRSYVMPLTSESPNAEWKHKGPLVFESGARFATNLKAPITIEYRVGRVQYQPVGCIVLPTPMLLYTETP